MSDVLRMWTVYDHPKDFPDYFVARLYEVDGSGVRATESVIQAKNLDTLREMLLCDMHLTCLPRFANDDPAIVEVWL